MDINEIANRIINNLDHSIGNLKLREIARNKLGVYKYYKKGIEISPLAKIRSYIQPGWKNMINSSIRHELDHCATAKFISISEEEKDKFILNYVTKKQLNPREEMKFRNFINTSWKKHNGLLATTGIDTNILSESRNGVDLRLLNEGITAYKQDLYDEYLGNKSYSSYKQPKKIAKFIANVIGKDNLIKYHFNNDYDTIRNLFRTKNW